MYDKLKDFHTRTGHGGNVKLRMALINKYTIPRPAIEAFLSTCLSKTVKNQWILNYQDHSTKFLSLRPLESKRAIEVARNLFSLFLTFGAPKILQSDNGRKFVNTIITELKTLWPDCVIVHGRPRHPQSQGSIERSNQDIENMLRAWVVDNNSKKWSIGLEFVQFQKNCSHHRVINRSPHKALFGSDPKIGLTTSKLPSEVLQKISTEEDLLMYTGDSDSFFGSFIKCPVARFVSKLLLNLLATLRFSAIYDEASRLKGSYVMQAKEAEIDGIVKVLILKTNQKMVLYIYWIN
ncbi:KRAB-A domain-containing protein 2-like [Rhopalosiphum padi]|uniref:KRAB-A domain-containing protein 2-like n=1 Tax=Rhopalosiphum padi TaxID=40932 RepID=UPI00298DDDE5|nr:KRAB-A domain-containing protein 2-like [Rhopalosiphum padi]